MKLYSVLCRLTRFISSLCLSESSKYPSSKYAALVLSAGNCNDYVESVSRVMKSLPDADTLFLNLRASGLERLEDALQIHSGKRSELFQEIHTLSPASA
ncbi:hypothetical protein [Candidatus Pyrohabitans sp.]